MNQTQRDAFELTRAAIRAVDAVFLRLARNVGALVRRYPTLDRQDRRRLMRQIDRLLDAAFGLTQRAALVSELFATILRATDAAAERPFLRLLQRVRDAVEARDPLLWRRIRPRLVASIAPPRVWALPDLDPTVPENWHALVQMIRQQSAGERFLRSGTLDPQRRWVRPGGYRLSDRVWKQSRWIRQKIDAEIVAAIRRGDGPVTLAKRLEDFLNPEMAPQEFLKNGRIVTKFAVGKRTGAGHASSFARALARTELMRIHGAATIEAAKSIPGVIGIRWQLSASHVEDDECNDAAGRDVGLGRGVYPVDSPPRYPLHVNEMCVLSHVHMSRVDVVDLLVRQYGGA